MMGICYPSTERNHSNCTHWKGNRPSKDWFGEDQHLIANNECLPTYGELQALILAPTRELANQVAEELSNIQGDAGLKIQTVYGGTDLEKQVGICRQELTLS